MSIDGTPVSSPLVATAYMTIDEANAYFATRLDTSVWDNASDDDKTKALIEATRAIDRLAFTGVKTTDYNYNVNKIGPFTQDHQFPRNGDTDIPAEIGYACCECAIAFLDGIDTDMEIRALSIDTNQFASVRQTKRANYVPPYILAGIPSAKAWMYLMPYLMDPREIRIRRI